MAGPSRPQDRVSLKELKSAFENSLKEKTGNGANLDRKATIKLNGNSSEMGNGSVAIAAITSCTNTSNPSVMVASGLVAKKAVEKGLTVDARHSTTEATLRMVRKIGRNHGIMSFVHNPRSLLTKVIKVWDRC